MRNPAGQEFNKFLVGENPWVTATTGNPDREVAVRNPAGQEFNKFLVGKNPWVTATTGSPGREVAVRNPACQEQQVSGWGEPLGYSYNRQPR